MVFFPYVIFLVLILAYGVIEIYEAIMVLRGDPKYTEKLLQETMSEAEQAVETIKSHQDEIEQAAAAHNEKEV